MVSRYHERGNIVLIYHSFDGTPLDRNIIELVSLPYDIRNMKHLVEYFSVGRETVIFQSISIFGKRNTANDIGELKVSESFPTTAKS